LGIVPILLVANMFLGVFYNLSIWYKLTDRTRFGAYLSVFGAMVTLVMNVLLIPVIGYTGSAWATFTCYCAMMVLSYFLGQKYYYVKYNIKKILGYLAFALILYFISWLIRDIPVAIKLTINTLLLLLYVIVIIYFEKPSLLKYIKIRK